ncbi:MAG: efflux RND transporter permease subunit, partial [Pseudomonadota bacterium]
MLSSLFFRLPRLTALTIGFIAVGALAALFTLARQEDPLLIERYGTVVTVLPGAAPERVEALITKKIEEELMELPEVDELESYSRAGISLINIALRDDLSANDVQDAWALIRQRVEAVGPDLPAEASEPEVEETYLGASTLMIAFTHNPPETTDPAVDPPLGIMTRLARELQEDLQNLPGTEETELYGQAQEEIRVIVSPPALAAAGLDVARVAADIRAADARLPAGQVRDTNRDILIEIDGELDTLDRIRAIPIGRGQATQTAGGDERFLRVGDIAEVVRSQRTPAETMAIVNGQRAIVLDVKLQRGQQVDTWAARARGKIESYKATMPDQLGIEIILDQSTFTVDRLSGLVQNLGLAALIVVLVLFVSMGWRSALIVGLALPFTIGCVLLLMSVTGIPLHQMSVTGMIIALGLLIDNAIVVVDDLNKAIRRGEPAGAAIGEAVSHLFVPLLASTVTTILAFLPIALQPGSTGEFIGALATVVIFSLASSFFLAMTVIPALAAFFKTVSPGVQDSKKIWWRDGFNSPRLAAAYRRLLSYLIPRPLQALGVGLVLPLTGFIVASTMENQFFPPVDRSQFQVQLVLPPNTALEETERTVRAIHERLMTEETILGTAWFLGENAPRAYYNAFAQADGQPNRAAGFVDTVSAEATLKTLAGLQADLRDEFPQAMLLALPYEQGPPFPAPIEVILSGPDLSVLRELGEAVRQILSETPGVTYSEAQILGGTPKIVFNIDEFWAEGAGFSLGELASSLQSTLEGAEGGSVLEGSEELPVRVVADSSVRGDFASITGLPVQPGSGPRNTDDRVGVPLEALGDPVLVPEVASINRLDGERINPIYGFLTPYTLPASALADFQRRISEAEMDLPPGYTMSFGGEAEQRGDAVAGLASKAGPLLVLMVATLVLSFNSFRYAGIVGLTGFLGVGLAIFGVWIFGYPLGFMA